MSVEKLSEMINVTHEKMPFTQISNNVIENIKSPIAFLIYAYLLSKSSDWIVQKSFLKNKFSVGNSTLKHVFSYLHRCCLIEYVLIKDEYGKIVKHDIRVLIGMHFKPDEPYIASSTGLKSDPMVESPENGGLATGSLSDPVVRGPLPNKDLNTKERINNKNYNKKKNEEEEIETTFNKFWSIYPSKQGKARAFQIWKKNKRYRDHVDDICEDILHRIKYHAHWQELAFVPHASTYLNQKRWQDEFVPIPQKKSYDNRQANNY